LLTYACATTHIHPCTCLQIKPSTPVLTSLTSIELFQTTPTESTVVLPAFYSLRPVGLGEDALPRSYEIVNVTGDQVLSGRPTIAPNGTLYVTPRPLTNGTARVSVRLRVPSGVYFNNESPVRTTSIIVQSVNRQPSFGIPSFVAVGEDEGVKIIEKFAENISIGEKEVGQLLTFTVKCDAAYLFDAQPQISPDGMLTFKPVPGR